MSADQRILLDKVRCRQIVNEILDFGVSQEQIKTTIKLLALELEDRELMLKINDLISTDIEVEEKPQLTI